MIGKWRRAVQVLSLLLMALIPLLNKKGISAVTGTFYSLAVGPVWITDPLIGIQTVLTTMSIDGTLLVSLLIPVLLTFVLGRVFCGWVCPQNTISEIVDTWTQKFSVRRWWAPRASSLPRYSVLLGISVLTPLAGIPLASLLSAPGIISVQVAQLVISGAIGLEIVLIGLIVIFEFFFIRRAWCNYLCPVGSFLGLFRIRKTLKVIFSADPDHVCGKCLACADACQVGLNPMEKGIYPHCNNCGACVAACDSIKGGKKPLHFKF